VPASTTKSNNQTQIECRDLCRDKFEKLNEEIELLETKCYELEKSDSNSDDGDDEDKDNHEVFVLGVRYRINPDKSPTLKLDSAVLGSLGAPVAHAVLSQYQIH